MVSDDKWKKLEDEVDKATYIRFFDFLVKLSQQIFSFLKIQWFKKPTMIFDSKTREECKYMKKYAEIKTSFYMIWISIAIFAIALGFSYYITFYNNNVYASIFGLILACIFAIIWILYINPKYVAYSSFILNAEKRLLSGDNTEHKQPQETTNTPSQSQENVPSKDYIKGELDFRKLLMTPLIGTFLIFVYNIQTSGFTRINGLFYFIAVILLLIIIAFDYQRLLNKLK